MVNYALETITSIEEIEDFNDEYVYDIIMEDSTTPYFFANDILVHNSNFLDLLPIVKQRYSEIPDRKVVLDFLLKYSDKVIEPAMTEFFTIFAKNMNLKQLTINMEAECIAETSIHLAKKKYMMNKVWDEGTFHVDKPKQKVRGVEIVRTSTPQYCRTKLKEAVNLIFDTKSNERLIEFIKETKAEFFTLPFETVAFPRGVIFSNYKLDSKGLPIAVRAAFIYNQHLKKTNLDTKYPLIEDGSKIKFCFIKNPNILHSNVIGFSTKFPEEWSKTIQIDYQEQWNKSFIAPLQNIFNAIKWQIEPVADLSDFFS